VHRGKLAGADGVFLLQIEDGVGPVTVSIAGQVTVERLEADHPDAVLRVTADQYVRLLAGRCPLSGSAGQSIVVQGDREKALALNRVFGGIANQ
jgi:SCP-2 sterol transfer family